MKDLLQPEQAPRLQQDHAPRTALKRRPARTLLAAVLTLGLAPFLSGCLAVKTRTVNRTVVADHVLDATVEQLEQTINSQYAVVQTLTLTIGITASTGGEHEGEVKDYPTFTGFIFLRKPGDLRVLMQAPIVRSRALDMVSDGKTFRLLIPPKGKAITGADQLAGTEKGGLSSLRPTIIRDAILVPAVLPAEFVTLTQDSRILAPAHGKKEAIEEPDYDFTVLRTRTDHVLERVRVVHISRITLRPYRQDVYDPQGRVVTVVDYGNYQKFGDVDFPMSILISRPLDEYKLKIDVSKLVLNQKLEDDSFQLPFPEGITVQKM